MRYFILPLVLLLISCSSTLPSLKTYKMDVQQGNVVTPKMMLQLKPAMTKSQVRFILGTPLLADTFHRDRWDYFYEMNRGGKVIERRRLILEFENEALKSVRGDIIPAGQPGAEDAPIASIKEIRSARGNKELLEEDKNKPWWERFKFWGDDTVVLPENQKTVDARVAPSPSQANTAAKPANASSTANPASNAKSANPPTEQTKASLALPVQVEVEQVKAQVERWGKAWQNRKLNDYLNIYSANFVPEGLSRRAWLEQQQQKFGSAEYAENIQIENVQVEVFGSVASVVLDQISSNAATSQKITKEISFENEAGLWRIVRETVKTEFAPQEVRQPASANQKGVKLYERSEQAPEYPEQQKPNPNASDKTAKPVANQPVTDKKPSTDKSQLPEIKPKTEVPLPAEDEPGYFEKLLQKIGF